jgi:uncharacterized protein
MIRIPTQHGNAFELKAGQRLKVMTPLGPQVADLFCVFKGQPKDSLSSGRSIDYEDSFLFTTGNFLISQSGERMFEIEDDTAGRNDFLVAPCSAQMFRMISGTDTYHPSCLENLTKALQPFGVEEWQIGTTFNLFMRIGFTAHGKIKLLKPSSNKNSYIVLKSLAEMIVGLTACADEGSNGGVCKPIDYLIY